MVPNGIKYMRLKIDVHRLIVLYLLPLLMMVMVMSFMAIMMMTVLTTMILGSKALCSWRKCHVPLLGGFPYLSSLKSSLSSLLSSREMKSFILNQYQ